MIKRRGGNASLGLPRGTKTRPEFQNPPTTDSARSESVLISSFIFIIVVSSALISSVYSLHPFGFPVIAFPLDGSPSIDYGCPLRC